jgi:hypothetical protein
MRRAIAGSPGRPFVKGHPGPRFAASAADLQPASSPLRYIHPLAYAAADGSMQCEYGKFSVFISGKIRRGITAFGRPVRFAVTVEPAESEAEKLGALRRDLQAGLDGGRKDERGEGCIYPVESAVSRLDGRSLITHRQQPSYSVALFRSKFARHAVSLVHAGFPR